MAFERRFVAAGGMLMVGCDPIGDQRAIELLIEAGFPIERVVRFATLNGATFQGIADRTGTVAPGKRADLLLVDGDLTRDTRAIERPSMVFKHGVAYDPQAIYAHFAGQAGLH